MAATSSNLRQPVPAAANPVTPHAMYELGILRHVEETPQLNNRTASKKLGVSIRLAHDVLKKMVHKGLLHVTVVHARRWDYFLTPKGLAEKTRLTMEFLDFSMTFYREARRRSAQLCRDLAEAGVHEVAFLGAGELAEITYLGVQEWGLCLTAVYDGDAEPMQRFNGSAVQRLGDGGTVVSPTDTKTTKTAPNSLFFMGHPVRPAGELRSDRSGAIIVCLYDKTQPMRGKYLPPGVVADKRMRWIFAGEADASAVTKSPGDTKRV